MDRSPRVVELGRAPGTRDGTRRPLAPLAEHLLHCVPEAVLVTLHSRRPACSDEDLLVWASIWFRGSSRGKVPERRVPAAVLKDSPLTLSEMERFELEALVLEITGSLPEPGWCTPALGGQVTTEPGQRPRLRVLRPMPEPELEPLESPARLANGSALDEDEAEVEPRPRGRGFLRVIDGGLS